MLSSLVLTLPGFSKEFNVETDASNTSVGVVLSQGGHLVAFISKDLTNRANPLSTYEKELLANVLALVFDRTLICGEERSE